MCDIVDRQDQRRKELQRLHVHVFLSELGGPRIVKGKFFHVLVQEYLD